MPPEDRFPPFDELMTKFGKSYFADAEKKVIRTELVDSVAQGLGFQFSLKRDDVKSAQMRRFYNDTKSLQTRIEAEGKDFSQFRAAIAMIKAKAAYAYGRKGSGRETKIPETFKRFLDTSVNMIHDRRDFDAFALVFESVVGYYYGFGGGK